MSERIRVISPKEYELSFGPVIFEGFQKGTFIKFEYDDELTEEERGADDEVAIIVKGSSMCTMTVTLMQTSICNAQLSVLAALVTDAPGMTGAIHPLKFRDPNGFTAYAAANAWVKKKPDAEFADTPQPREWKIRIAHLKGGEGGN